MLHTYSIRQSSKTTPINVVAPTLREALIKSGVVDVTRLSAIRKPSNHLIANQAH